MFLFVFSLAWLSPWTTSWTWRRLPGTKTSSSTPCSGSSRSSKVIPSILTPTADQIRRFARKIDSTCSVTSRSSKVIPSILAPTDLRKMDYPILATADQIRRFARKVNSTCSGFNRSSKLIKEGYSDAGISRKIFHRILTPADQVRRFTGFCLRSQ